MCVYRFYFKYSRRTDSPLSISDISLVEYKINFAHSILTVSSRETYKSDINGEYNHYYFPNITIIRALNVSVNNSALLIVEV